MALTHTRLLVLLLAVTLTTQFTEGREGDNSNSIAGPSECGRQVVQVQEGQVQWIVSPGLRVPGVTNGSQNICQWTVKAGPGYGVSVEVVRLRLPRSRRCARNALHILPALSNPRPRPLTRFCGRSPKTRVWKTTFSEISINYRKRRTGGSRGKGRGRDHGEEDAAAKTPHKARPRTRPFPPGVSPALSRAEKLERIKELRRLYLLKLGQSEANEVDHSRRHNRRRFYRHVDEISHSQLNNHTTDGLQYSHLDQFTYTSHNHTHRSPGSKLLVLDGDTLEYDVDTNTYGAVITQGHTQALRMVGVGEPTWVTGDKASIHGEHNWIIYESGEPIDTETEEQGTENESNWLTDDPNTKVTLDGEASWISDEMGEELGLNDLSSSNLEKYKRQTSGVSTRGLTTPTEAQQRQLNTRQHRTSSQYRQSSFSTMSRSRQQHHSRRQYRVHRNNNSVNNSPHRRRPALPRKSLHPQARDRNEITPRKPTKPYHDHHFKKFGYGQHPARPHVTSSRPGGGHVTSPRPRTERRKKRHLFVLKVTAWRTSCGGEVTEERGRFHNPHYPDKAGDNTACYWNFKTPAGSHWKLVCEDFEVRRSRGCRRDHLAIRISGATNWNRYCGEHGPILALTSSHQSSVDVVLSALRNSSARAVCTWDTTRGGRSSFPLGRDYTRYWSYNLTHATTTTTTTTTTPPPRPPSITGWTCEDYRHLNSDHTMCRSTPSSCAIYRNGVTSEDRLAIVIAHNEYRAKVARGEEGEGLPGPQYSATDMQELAWNEELARVAQAWASACPDNHDCHDCRKILSENYYVGQNIFYEWSSSNEGSVWETAIRLWYEEVKYVPNYLVKTFRSMNHAVIGHYTQLVWGPTKEVGCGAAYHDCSKVIKGRSWKLKCKIYVCNYGPAGNMLNQPMYNIGPPATSCPDHSRPSARYPGLCTAH